MVSVSTAVTKYNTARTTRGPELAKGVNTVFTKRLAAPLCSRASPKGRIPPSRKITFQSIAWYASSMVRQRPRTMPTAPMRAAAKMGTILNVARVITVSKRSSARMARSLRRYSSVNSLVTIKSLDLIRRAASSLSPCSSKVSPPSRRMSSKRSLKILPRLCSARTPDL